MRLDKDNVYFLPPDNKNGLSTAPPNRFDLCDKFEFIVKVKPDLEKLKANYDSWLTHLGPHNRNQKKENRTNYKNYQHYLSQL